MPAPDSPADDPIALAADDAVVNLSDAERGARALAWIDADLGLSLAFEHHLIDQETARLERERTDAMAP